MKKVLLLLVLISTTIVYSCEGSNEESESTGYCTYNGHTLYTGEKGGCYYLSSGGNKEYVDKSYCRKCN